MRDKIPVRVLAYARVSTVGQEQHGTSLAAQEAELRKWCKDNKYPAPELFIEVEGGGVEKEERRVEQIRLMASVRPGDLVLCCKQDRWSRDTLYYLTSTRKIMALGARFFSIGEKFDPSTPDGEFASTVMASTARLEHARIRERTVGTRQRLRREGAFVEGLPPLGYKAKDRKLVVDQKAAGIIRHMFALRIQGCSLRKISIELRKEFPGVRGLDWAAISRRLRDRRYIGASNTIGSKKHIGPIGEWVETHDPIVDLATWYQAQDATEMHKRSGRPLFVGSRNARFLLRGMIFCGHCGHVLTAHAAAPTDSVKHGGYYQCRFRTSPPPGVRRCVGPFARYADVDAAVSEEVERHLEKLAERLAQPLQRRQPSPTKDYDAERRRLLSRRSNLVNAIAEGVVSTDVARDKMVAIEQGLAALEAERAAAARPTEVSGETRAAMLRQVEHLRKAWRGMTVEEKREAIGLLADRIRLYSTSATKWSRGTWRLEITWRIIN